MNILWLSDWFGHRVWTREAGFKRVSAVELQTVIADYQQHPYTPSVLWAQLGVYVFRVWTTPTDFRDVSILEVHKIIDACRLMGMPCNEVEDNA